jgi:hypothetical protein
MSGLNHNNATYLRYFKNNKGYTRIDFPGIARCVGLSTYGLRETMPLSSGSRHMYQPQPCCVDFPLRKASPIIPQHQALTACYTCILSVSINPYQGDLWKQQNCRP